MRSLLPLLLVGLLAPPAMQQSTTRLHAPPHSPSRVRERGAQSHRFATQVVGFVQGTGAGLFDRTKILGPPRGGGLGSGSLDVLSLGVGGQVTLGFDVVLCDGPGADLIVFENAIMAAGAAFSEVAFVEVSSDGSNFARCENSYAGPPGPLPSFATLPLGSYRGFTGCLPVLANDLTNSISPFDPVVSGGEAFDLADLSTHALVVAGTVLLDAIRYVRLVDVEAGTQLDSNGTLIWDHGAPGSADIDAVAVLQHTGNQGHGRPAVDFFVDATGFGHLVVSDPDGLGDLTSWRASIDLVEVPFATLEATFLTLLSSDHAELHWITPLPLQDAGLMAVLAVSVLDGAGHAAADQLILQAP